MKGYFKLFTAITAVAVAAMFVPNAYAANLASDVASDPAYDPPGFWATGDNGGFGFGMWTLSASGTAGHFIWTSTGNAGGSSGGIDTAGESFGMYANAGSLSEAIRPFTGGPLTIGQIFLIDFDNGWIEPGGTVGLGLQTSAGVNRIEFFFVGGASNYTIQHGATATDSGVGWTGDGLKLEFHLTGADTMTVVIKNTAGTTLATHSGLALGGTAGTGIDRVRLFNFAAGGTIGGSNYDAFYNSLAIIPEPSTIALVWIGLLGALALRRRKA